MNINTGKNNPIAWISSLYFAEGVPYLMVMTIALVFYHDIGISNADVALYTSWLYLPWVIKPFWSPIVDIYRNKRWWILAMQSLIAVALAGVAFTLELPSFLEWTLAFFWLMAFSSATHDIAADGFYMLALSESQQSFYVGIRSTFYRISTIVTQGGLLLLVSYLQDSMGIDVQTSWQYIFLAVGLFFVLFVAYHHLLLPRPAADADAKPVSAVSIAKEYFEVFFCFFKKKHIIAAILFMLLYRLPEALLVKICPLFFLDQAAAGGLSLTKGDLGFIQGTIGIVGLLLGGILGGMAASRFGLKRCLWVMACAISIPDVVYLILSYSGSVPDWLVVLSDSLVHNGFNFDLRYEQLLQQLYIAYISIMVCIEQLGYGFGFTAYMLYMIYISRGEHRTAHYAFCTGFMALSMMIPGMFAGWLQEQLGYTSFFALVCVLTCFTFFATGLVKVEVEFGKSK